MADWLEGKDSVDSIQLRLLGDNLNLSAAEVDRARMTAEDIFEVKVEIIHEMTPLHPEGNWLGQGARVLDNPRTKSGEESLENLLQIRDELQARNPQTIEQLKEKMLGRKKHDEDTESAA